jgi:hypothetical protein
MTAVIVLRRVLVALAALGVAGAFTASASAAEGPKISLGYAFLRYLESGGRNVPAGAYLSGWGQGHTTLELDIGWHHDHEDSEAGSVTLNTFTFLAGPRATLGGKNDKPYFHLLGGARYDRVEGLSNTSWGGAAGLGIDLGTGSRSGPQIRLGADFEMFFESGENVKALRLTAGFTF